MFFYHKDTTHKITNANLEILRALKQLNMINITAIFSFLMYLKQGGFGILKST